MLLELSSSDEPVWTYFDSQHKHILDQMEKAYHTSLNTVKDSLSKNSHGSSPDSLKNTLMSELYFSVAAVESKQADTIIGAPLSKS